VSGKRVSQGSPGGRFASAWPLIVLAVLVTLGIGLEALGLFDWRRVLGWARAFAGDWRLAAGIILVQVALFTFALPGSALLWLAAPLYSAVTATLILTVGGTAGAATAYLFARRLTRTGFAKAKERRVFRLLEARGDFLTLCALRMLPGVPHSVINYASGILRLPLPSFLAATALGLAVKTFLYSSAIHGFAESGTPADLLRPETMLPLFGLALLLLLGRLARSRL
jgi:uncharacterized membrane protein YdjX (TVP38/TMEM64 family)